MSSADPRRETLLREILDRHCRTFAQEAGIRLTDEPAPLFQLLTLTLLLSARISAGIAVSAAKELFEAGYRTPNAMNDASWRSRVTALGRGGYRRYDERTATTLGEAAGLALTRWRGDLRLLHAEAGDDALKLTILLTEFKGIGPVGAQIFLREVQAVWPGISPYVDDRVKQGALRVGLPTSPNRLSAIARSPPEMAELAAALVRLSLDARASDELLRVVQARPERT
ncbi:endonuclease [Kribbella sp. NPDC056861]|uniref:endonuclease n=1 Tax=Kribbella sp. NPDC056861 TaxID=3154857 RepID=UPI00341DA325